MVTLARSFAQQMQQVPNMPPGSDTVSAGVGEGMNWAGKAQEAAQQMNPSG